MDDDFFGPPSIRTDEWRDAPYRHRYVRGSFDGTDTRFLFMFPEPDAHGGRFVQFLGGGAGGDARQGVMVGMPARVAAENGAYYVESNQGHVGNDMSGLKGDGSILYHRASAQTARLGRQLAEAMYGKPPHHGYVIGPSGGAMRALQCLEAAPDVWDGAVPWMVNRTPLHQFHWSLSAWAGAVLGERLPEVVDAMAPGGSGDPEATLDASRRDALRTLYRGGYPRGAEAQLAPNPLWLLGMRDVRAADPDYPAAFWSEPGYEGRTGEAAGLLFEGRGEVGEVVRAGDLLGARAGDDLLVSILARFPREMPVGLRLREPLPLATPVGASLRFTSGAREGQRVHCSGVVGDALTVLFDPGGLSAVAPGDAVEIDNRDLVAFMFYHRHLVDPRYPGMRQFFDGQAPRFARRDVDFDRLPTPAGRFAGKMILIQHSHDRECWPICAEAYARDVRAELSERLDDRFRLWWIDNAAHVVPLGKAGRTRLIDHGGIPLQATRDLIRWVEHDEAPPASTRYRLHDSGELELPSTAAERAGVQPVVSLQAAGGARAEVRVGEPVELAGVAEVPAGAGTLVTADWDFDGSGSWPERARLDGESRVHRARMTHRFAAPGTHFVSFRVASERSGEADSSRRVQSLARARVVVR